MERIGSLAFEATFPRSRAPLGLLGRARSMMKGWSDSTSSRAQSYSVACADGHRLRGQRTDGYQALRCPTCGDPIFVLPRSPLPEPPVPTSTSTSSRTAVPVASFDDDDPVHLSDPPEFPVRGRDEELPEAEIDWVEDPAAPTDPVEVPTVSTRPHSQTTRPKPGPVKRPAAEPVVPSRPPFEIREWVSRHRNPLLVVGLILFIIAAVSIRRHRQRLDEYPRIAELGRTEGLKKLDAGEFHSAKQILREAADAVDGLGGRIEGAAEIRQGALEAAIFADLASKGIEEIVEEAATSEPKDWASRFTSLYRGRSIILDPPISEVPDQTLPGSTYQVAFPLYFGRGTRPGKGRIDLAGFRLFELAQPKVGEQKPFGARLAAVELDPAKNEWVVKLQPDSGVFITHPRALEAIDWNEFEPAEEPLR